MADERVKPEEFKAFCVAIGKCYRPALSNRGLVQRLGMDEDRNELNRQSRTPARGQLPRPASFLNDFLDKVDAELRNRRSELYASAAGQSGPLKPWLSFENGEIRVARERLRKSYTLDDYVSSGYLSIDLGQFRDLETVMQNAPPFDGAKWTDIVRDLTSFWKASRGKAGTCFLPHVSRLIVESTKRFNSHPPDSPNVDRIAADLFRMLRDVGRQSHYGRFQESRVDMELRHEAILVRATQFHAGCSVKKARALYRLLLDIPAGSDPKVDFLLAGKVPDDADRHAAHVLTNVLCFEVCLGMDNDGDPRWWCLDAWLADLHRRARHLNEHGRILQSYRIEAEWHLSHLGMKIPKWEQIKHAKAAQDCVQHVRELAPGGLGGWMEWEILKLESIIALVLESKKAIAAKHDRLSQVAMEGQLHSQAYKTAVFRQLTDHIDLYVQFAIQLHHGREVLKQLKLRTGQGSSA